MADRSGHSFMRTCAGVIAALTSLWVVFGAGAAFAATGVLATGGAVFYTASLTIVFAFFLINFALQNKIGVFYAVLFILMLALVFALEGGLRVFATDLTEERALSCSLAIGFAGAGFGYFTAERAIAPERKMRHVRRAFILLAGLSIILIPLSFVLSVSALAVMANALLFGMFAAHLVSTSTWRLLNNRPNRLAQIIAATQLGVVALMAVAYFTIFDRESLMGAHAFRYVYAFAAAPTMAGIIIALIDMRRSHERSLETALAAARRDAETSAALLEMEKNYSRARDTAANRGRRMSVMSHDIRQPIASLRAELDVLKQEIAPENIARLDRIAAHFTALTDDLSRSAGAESQELHERADEKERVPASLYLKMLERMFTAEADARGVELRIVECSRAFDAPATALMRVGANLVSNAIQHAAASKILIGARRRGERLELIIGDDGVGLSSVENHAADIFTAGVKSERSAGEGLGLSIVKELADEHGFDLRVRSSPGRGVMFSVLIAMG